MLNDIKVKTSRNMFHKKVHSEKNEFEVLKPLSQQFMYIILLVIKCESFGVRMLVRPFWKKQNMAVFQFFFNWDSLHARLNSHYEAWSYKKRSKKKITGYRKSV